jgi:hypothetical protein
MPSPSAPLAGREWGSALANWVRNYSTQSTWDIRTRLEFPPEGLTSWMFRELTHELPPFGEHGLRAYPAYVLAALLAPMAGLHPEHREAQINDAIARSSKHSNMPWLNRVLVVRLLQALFGNDMVAHPSGDHPFPADVEGLRFWAALRGNGELWVSDARWGETGAFLIEYPTLSPGLNPMDTLAGKMSISWDANLDKFYDPENMPTVLTWSGPPEDFMVAPWEINPPHTAKSMLDLLTSVSFAPVNLLPSTVPRSAHASWPSDVHVSLVDPPAKRVSGAVQEKSELLCHAEAWIAGLRYEALHWRMRARDEDIDAASLLSVLSSSVNQCPIEQRLVETLCAARVEKRSWAGLRNLPDGEWLEGVLEDLVGANCKSAHLTFASANTQMPEGMRALGAEHGTLQAWLTPDAVLGEEMPFITRGRLNIHVSGPLFGPNPATLSRAFAFAPKFLPRDLRVVLGEITPPAPGAASKRLVFHFVSQPTSAESQGLYSRAESHREFWNALLDFNGPHGF